MFMNTEVTVLLFRDCFGAARITGERYQALMDAGIRFDDMRYGLVSTSPLVSEWKPGTEFQYTGNMSDCQAVLLFEDLVATMTLIVEYNTYDKWHFYIVRKRI